MGTTKVVFVRHGESEWNQMNLFCGWQDVNLSEKGEWDAINVSAAAIKAQNCQFDIAFTSSLKRANRTLELILNTINCPSIPIYSDWHLNERHYGELTGFNKRQMAKVYGEEQVQIWRRSYDICPPQITPLNPYYEAIRNNPKFENIPIDQFPFGESLASTMQRVIPFWENRILPEIRKRKRILVVAHGTSLRGIVKHIQGMTKDEIIKFNIPNSIPFTFDFDVKTLQPVSKIRFLADEETVAREMNKVASIGN